MVTISPDISNVLVLVAVSLSGLTFIGFVSFLIYYCCRSNSNWCCHRAVNPARKESSTDTDAESVDSFKTSPSRQKTSHSTRPTSPKSVPLTPKKTTAAGKIPKKTDHRTKPQPDDSLSDSISIVDEQLNTPHHHRKGQQRTYTNDTFDDTTMRTSHRTNFPSRKNQPHATVRPDYSPEPRNVFKPVTDIGNVYRETPYPPDILNRERIMNNMRHPKVGH